MVEWSVIARAVAIAAALFVVDGVPNESVPLPLTVNPLDHDIFEYFNRQ